MDSRKDHTDVGFTGESRALSRVSPNPLGGEIDLSGLDNLDATRIMNTVNALLRMPQKAAQSLLRELQGEDARTKIKKDTEKRELRIRDEKDTRSRDETRDTTIELINLARWNAQMTTVGGVQMTNEEAQNTRQHIIDNDEYYADRAVREGRIQASERDEYKAAIRRIHELKDREGRGIATDADKRECARIQQSRVGRETENDTGRTYLESRKNLQNDASVKAIDTNDSVQRWSAAPVDESLFQSAPKLSAEFKQAKQSTTPLDQPEPVPQQPSPKVAAMGLGI